MVPVLLTARGLAAQDGSWAMAFRAAVAAELGKGLKRELPADLFDHPPAEGASWLVMIDALDEVVEPGQRDALASAIIAHAAGAHSRYVLTSRTLAELDRFKGDGVTRYTLLPFEPQDLPKFAEKWFAGSPEQATGFVREVENSRIADLARVPLLLAMAASIYNPRQGLPAQRAAIYQAFVEKVLAAEVDKETLESFTGEWKKYGARAVEAAETLFLDPLPLLRHLALWQQQGGTGSLAEEAGRFVCQGQLIPVVIRGDGWLLEQMRELLRRSGLVVGEAQDFAHETLREYLAAAELARLYPHPGDSAAAEVIDRWPGEKWREVLLFLLGIWGKPKADAALRRIPVSTREGALFAGAALADGLQVDQVLEATVVERLLFFTRIGESYYQFAPNHPLTLLGRLRRQEQVITGLSVVASDNRVNAWVRCDAVQALGRLRRAAELLQLANDNQLDASVRRAAAEALGRLGHDDEASTILRQLAADNRVDAWVRGDAVQALGRLRRAAELLQLAHDNQLDAFVRRVAAQALDGLGHDDEASTILRQLARDINVAG